MTTKKCKKSGRKHTPIVSKAEQRKMRAELRRRERGEKPQMPGMTKKELKRHIEESEGKDLPERVHKKKGKRSS